MLDNAVGGAPRPWWSGDAPGGHAGAAGPTVLGHRYRLDEVIGRGGAATVYRAHDELLDRVVAVKVLPAVPRDSDDLRRHQAEIRVLAGLRHPGLVRLLDADTVPMDGPAGAGEVQAYLVMELVAGPTLGRRLAAGPLSVAQTASVGRAAAEALAVVHGHDVIHRDVKPGNILLTTPDCLDVEPDDDALEVRPVKLVDFGIARLAAATRLTMTGTIVGTASYLSPEQAEGGVLGPSSDVYALGLVLLECVTGRPAFVGTMAEVAAARLARDPDVPGEVDARLGDLLVRMTRRQPHERPTAEDVAHELSDLLVAGPPQPATPPVASDATLVLPAQVAPTVPGPARRPPVPTVAEALVDPAARAAVAADAPPARATSRWAQGSSHLRRLGRAGSRRVLLLAVLAVGLVVAGLLTVQGLTGAPAVPDPPAYPAVDGPLGESLTRLQRSVAP